MFKPALIREIGGHRIAVIGQAFPYVPIAHPEAIYPGLDLWNPRRGIAKLVDALRNSDKVDAIVLLSHNGMDVDLKLASRCAASTSFSAAIPTMPFRNPSP